MSEQVQRMFADIAPTYDVTNTVLSFGVHHLWRNKAVKESSVSKGDSVIDCATGTGDLALTFKKAVGDEGYVLGTDFCPEMLASAPAKANKRGMEVDFEVADAMELNYEADRFDAASISFGIRNVDDPVQCLRAMSRVVRPGGKVVVLEFGQPKGFFGALFRFYSNVVMPTIGGLISGNRDAYVYLPQTSAEFPAGENFVKLMEEAGTFSERKAIPLTFGVTWLYVGTVA